MNHVQKMFTIRDSKAGTFNPPFCQNSHAEAERTFSMQMKNDQSMISKFPEDYDLYYLGTFDTQSGKIEALDSPQHVIKAIQFAPQLKPATA